MSFAGALAALAVLLAGVGARELLAFRGSSTKRRSIDLTVGRRTAAAALRLGLPDRLSRAGLQQRIPLAAVLLVKLAAMAVGGITALAAAPAAPGRISFLVAVGMPAAGFFLPDALLERRARLRNRRLLGALPDAFDLLAVGATAGRSTTGGFGEIARAGQSPLADEMRMAVAELSCGRPL
jgi:tight adherence protein C